MRRKKVADTEEVLEALTSILRRENEARPGEVLKAAELLGKQYGLFSDKGQMEAESPSIVVDVPKEEADANRNQE